VTATASTIRLPSPCLVVLVGPSGAGKTTWAQANFRPEQIVSSDALRALVGEGEHDQRASKDAFDVLDTVLDRRLRRGLLTVVDTLGLDGKRRAGYVDLAARHRVACVAVGFDTPAGECRARNKQRRLPVPPKVLADQLQTWNAVRPGLAGEGFAAVYTAGEADHAVRIVPKELLDAPAQRARQQEDPVSLDFQLQIPNFTWEGGPPELATRLAAIAQAAEGAGFTGLWVMDHFLQIPPNGPEWLDMLESYTTLAFLAGHTSTVTLGTMVTGVTYRNVAHLAKIVATLDVLSGGRAVCGLGAAWFDREHRAYGYEFPPLAMRFAILEDALQALPLMWGPGSPPFEGRVVSIPEAMCYPRPLQEKIPILIGGGGERRTLRLVAKYADACNLFGDAATVAHKVEVLHRHCADVGRDPADVRVTHLSTALTAGDESSLAATVERLKPERMTPEAWAARVNAGTVHDAIGRFRGLADAGVQTAVVSLPDLGGGTEPIERFTEVIAAFSAA
jgi:F420-dependent oxidoreductase-like protein